MIPLSDGSKTEEELHDDRSEHTNAKSVDRLDIGCITDEVPTQAEIEKYITIGHIPLPKHCTTDLDKQTIPEITLKICGSNRKMNKREFLVWSQVKQALCYLPCRMFGTQLVQYLQGLH